MSNIFDRIGAIAFDAITTTFGYSAIWQPLASPETTLVAIVGFGQPIGDNLNGKFSHSIYESYEVFNYWMEYKNGDFPGLIESVRNGSSVNSGNEEIVTITTDVYPEGQQFYVQEVKSIYDGRCFKAKLQKVE